MMTDEHCKEINDKIISVDIEGLMDKALDIAKVKYFNEVEDSRFSGLIGWVDKQIEEGGEK